MCLIYTYIHLHLHNYKYIPCSIKQCSSNFLTETQLYFKHSLHYHFVSLVTMQRALYPHRLSKLSVKRQPREKYIITCTLKNTGLKVLFRLHSHQNALIMSTFVYQGVFTAMFPVKSLVTIRWFCPAICVPINPPPKGTVLITSVTLNVSFQGPFWCICQFILTILIGALRKELLYKISWCESSWLSEWRLIDISLLTSFYTSALSFSRVVFLWLQHELEEFL